MAAVDLGQPNGPRHLRSAPAPLGLYLRVGRNDHTVLLELIARGDAQCFGLIPEATAAKRHRELRQQALAAGLDTILDPRTQAAATIGGHSQELAALPWGLARPHRLEDFKDAAGQRRMASIADFALEQSFTQVLAPTHLVNASTDPWFRIDCESTGTLRRQLDSAGGRKVQILYSLAIPYALLRDEHECEAFVAALTDIPADAIWLRIEGLGAGATANGVRNYMLGANAFKALEKPVVADGIGGLAGLSLLAFGAAGGIAHGITFGERVDHSTWRRPRVESPFGRKRRVYLSDLDLLLEPDIADELIHSSPRAAGLLSCRDTHCCPRGIKDTIENPGRHYLIQRMKQIVGVGRVPLAVRSKQFVDDFIRPASDVLAQVSNWSLKNEDVLKMLRKQRRRVDGLRVAMRTLAASFEPQRPALPRTRIAREPRPGL
jgi:hypothetical protein